MNNQIQIRQLGIDDLLTLQSISITTFDKAFGDDNTEENMNMYIKKAFSKESLLEELNNSSSLFYFALLNDEIVGYLKLNSGNAQGDLQDENGLEVSRIYVEEKYQGHKIGKKLLEKAMEIAVEKNVDFVWLGVWEKNAGAIRFYERNGFVKFSTHSFMLGEDQQTDVLMKRPGTELVPGVQDFY